MRFISSLLALLWTVSLAVAQSSGPPSGLTAWSGAFVGTEILWLENPTDFKVSMSQIASYANLGDVTSNANPTAGQVGEVLTCSGSSVTLGTGTQVNICSQSITAGHWICNGTAAVNNSTTQLSSFQGGMNTTTGTLPAINFEFVWASTTLANNIAGAAATRNFNFTSTTSVFLVAETTSTGGTNTGSGQMYCQRIW